MFGGAVGLSAVDGVFSCLAEHVFWLGCWSRLSCFLWVEEVAGPAFVFFELRCRFGCDGDVCVDRETCVFGPLGRLLNIFELISMERGLTHKEYNLIRASVCISKIKLFYGLSVDQ